VSLLDITRTLGLDDRAYPGDLGFAVTRTHAAETDGYTLSEFRGTHFDVPAHFFAGGATVEQFPLERFDVPALVVDCGAADNAGPEHLAGLELPRDGAVLFRTRNGGLPRDRYTADHCALTLPCAQALITAGVGIAGIDYISVERGNDPQYPVHRALLAAGVLLLEDVDLRHVAPGRYRLRCYPLRIAGAEAAPCRAVLSPL
jgi:arylformamidase